MLELMFSKGKAKNSEGRQFEVDYHLTSRTVTIGEKVTIDEGSIEMLQIIKKGVAKDDIAFRFAEYGAIFGIVASVGAIFLGNYNEPADYLMGFAVNILIYGLLGIIIGQFIKIDKPYYTFKIRDIQQGSIWEIECYKVLYDFLGKCSKGNIGLISENDPVHTEMNKIQKPAFKNNIDDSSTKDSVTQLEKYYDLFQKGVINENEYNEIKKKIIVKELEK